MNKKTLVIFFIGLILSIIIFKITYKEKINYLALGDEITLGYTPFDTYNKSYSDYFSSYLKNKNKLGFYITDFSKYDYTIEKLLDDMEEVKEIKINKKIININQAISSADIITLSFGQRELYILLNKNYNEKLKNIDEIYKYVDSYFDNYVSLLNKIRKINSNKIFIIGLYNPLTNTNQNAINKLNEIFKYMNKKFSTLEENKNIFYINISNEMDNKNYYVPNYKNPYPSLEGYNYISNELICKISKKC
jgi:lysophospholipase L1-like esterase